MNVPTTLVAFGASLAVIFAGAVGVGTVVGPTGTAVTDRHDGTGHAAGSDGAAVPGSDPAASTTDAPHDSH